MKPISVKLTNASYDISVGSPLSALGHSVSKIRKSKNALIVTHPSIYKLYGPLVEKSLSSAGISPSVHLMPEGEHSKTLRSVEAIYQSCLRHKLDRSSWIVALGGGVAGDVAGFAAATYLRGIPLVQVPTTLLAMVDSSIGGKTGVDLKEAKNYVGSFYQPKLVWADIQTLKTLPEREFINGLAEVIKYGVIWDPKLFQTLEAKIRGLKNDFSTAETIVRRCAEIKAKVVSEDEKETKGLREILNFGHTWGHVIETMGQYKIYKHGEAISIGMCAAGQMAAEEGLWSKDELTRMEDLLEHAGLPLKLLKPIPAKPAMQILARDKKNLGGRLRFVLPSKIGKMSVKEVVPELALKGLEYVQP